MIASTIKARRLQLGIAQAAFGGQIELDKHFVSLMETDSTKPSVSVIWRRATEPQLTASERAAVVDRRFARLQNALTIGSARKSPPGAQGDFAARVHGILLSPGKRDARAREPRVGSDSDAGQE